MSCFVYLFFYSTDSNYKFLWLNDRNDTLYAGVYQGDDSVSPLFMYSQNGASFSGTFIYMSLF